VRRMHLIVVLLSGCFLLSGCVKRLPASAGPERTLQAGETISLGQKVEVPEGANVTWTTSDGAKLKGPSVTHAWDLPGEYQVTVTVTDPDGQQRSDKTTIKVTCPGLLEVLPQNVEALILFERPGERLKELPLFLERLLASGRDANAALAALHQIFGFDPFDNNGLKAAGVDPLGGIGLIQLSVEDKLISAIVVSVLNKENILETIRTDFSAFGQMKEAPSSDNMAVIEVRSIKPDLLMAAYTIHQGHLWVSFAFKDNADPVKTLVALRANAGKGRLVDSIGYKLADKAAKERGGIHLYLSSWALLKASQGEPAVPHSKDQQLGSNLIKKVTFFRGDADLSGDGFEAHTWLGFKGDEIADLSDVFKAHNSVPAFGTYLPPDQHLTLKLSAGLPGLIKTILKLGNEEAVWGDMLDALGHFGSTSGVKVKPGLLDNIGDNYLISLRFKPIGLMEMAAASSTRPPPDTLFDLVSLVQLRDQKLFEQTIKSLAAFKGTSSFVKASIEQGHPAWTIGPDYFPLTLVIEKGFGIIAINRKLAIATAAQLAKPVKTQAGWPAEMDLNDRQVLFANVNGFISDFKKSEPSKSNPSAAFVKAMVMSSLGRIESLSTVVIDMALQGSALAFNLKLSLL
jgi:PKD domain-containing protein